MYPQLWYIVLANWNWTLILLIIVLIGISVRLFSAEEDNKQ